MEDKSTRLFTIDLLGENLINTITVIGLFVVLVNLHFKMFNYWDFTQVELMLTIVGIGAGLFGYWMWKKWFNLKMIIF